MSPWLAIICRPISPSSTSPGIAKQTTVEGGLVDNWCHKSMEGRLAIGYSGQLHFSGRPHRWLPGFDLHWCQWSLMNRFQTGQGHCGACHKKWGFKDFFEVFHTTNCVRSHTTNCVTVEKSRRCHTSSTFVHWPSLTAVYCTYMKQMRLPSTGWQHMTLSTR